MIAFTKKNLHQTFTPGILQRDVRKCWLREFLESAEKFLSSISILMTNDLSHSIGALVLFLL